MALGFRDQLIRIGKAVFGWFYPSLCPVCGEPLADGEQTICLKCRWEMPLTDYWRQHDNPCRTLLSPDITGLEEASALFFFRHENLYRSMIHSMKYGGRRDIARSLGEMFGRELQESPLYDDIDLLIPVPLHWSKRIRRSYNQSEEICLGLARSMRLPTDFYTLKRIRATRTQAFRSSTDARRRNVEGAFRLRRPERLRGKHILLVDDVLTTGSTLTACAEALTAAQPDLRISIATLAAVRPRK